MLKEMEPNIKLINNIDDVPELKTFDNNYKDKPKLIVFDDFINLSDKDMRKINEYFNNICASIRLYRLVNGSKLCRNY